MITIKQAEALYWIVHLGGFSRAADKLHTTQSAVSKRISELEELSSAPLFDRTLRNARLTEKGEKLLAIATSMLKLRDEATALLKSKNERQATFRIGVTELSALTWFPRFVSSMRVVMPALNIKATVEPSATLLKSLRQARVDSIVLPNAYNDEGLVSIPLDAVQNRWMASPALVATRKAIPLDELSRWPILSQDDRSGSGALYRKWLEDSGVNLQMIPASNSLIALLGLVVSGMGVSFFPEIVTRQLIKTERIRIINTIPALPPVQYAAMFQSSSVAANDPTIIGELQRCCNFESMSYLRTG